MVQCLQNHTPKVMVIDEIGRKQEVEAARTIKNRGVRILASAHGDLRGLVKNAELSGLVGGKETVTLGDAMAKEQAKAHGGEFSKTRTQRAGPPTFEIIIEVSSSNQHEWRIVFDSATAVDAILNGEEYEACLRTRDPSGRNLRLRPCLA
jgi:hypothetical protein